MNNFRMTGFSILPVMVKNLLIINGLLFIAKVLLQQKGINLDEQLGLHYFSAVAFRPWQPITYMFMHGGFGHLFFNMFALWMFGSSVENVWGSKRFLFYYFITGVGAAAIQLFVCHFRIQALIHDLSPEALALVQNQGYELLLQGKNYIDSSLGNLNLLFNSVTIGASGSVFGILLAFGMMYPNVLIYIYFLFPVKAKWMVMGYGALELIYGVTGTEDGIAHFAHLGGMLFGLILILIWRKRQFNKYRIY